MVRTYVVAMSSISYVYIGNPKLRKVITLTSDVEKNWFKLGMELQIPISIMERLYEKHNANPIKALNRVYCYWLSDKNDLSPTWETLCSALRKINLFTIAANVENFIKVSLITEQFYGGTATFMMAIYCVGGEKHTF